MYAKLWLAKRMSDFYNNLLLYAKFCKKNKEFSIQIETYIVIIYLKPYKFINFVLCQLYQYKLF